MSTRRRLVAELRAPLRLVFGRGHPAVADDGAAPPAPMDPEVEFIAYATDCTLSGHVRLSAERLSDLLNAHESFQLVDVLVTPLDGAPPIELGELLIAREELLLVHAGGPRGNAARRRRTREHPILVRADPYEIHGYLHSVPGGDAIESFRRRPPMVALTNAVVRFPLAGRRHERRVGTLVVNRELIDWVAQGEDEKMLTLDVPVDDSGPLLKDFTGDVIGG